MRIALIVLTLLCTGALTLAQEATSPWQVRRARTSDADRSGRYPTWTVSLSGEADALDVDIAEDPEAENARGHIFIVRKVTVPEEATLATTGSYATFCVNDNRCGAVELVAFTPEQFEALSDATDTEFIYRHDPDLVSVSYNVYGHVGEDVTEPVEIGEDARVAFSYQLRSFRGREMYVGAGWSGLHTGEEWGKLRGLNIESREWKPPVHAFFDRIDLDLPGLEQVKAAWEAGEEDLACEGIVTWFRERTEPRVAWASNHEAEHKVSASQLEEAEMALQNKFLGQSKYGFIEVADPIDWSFNPVVDREWPWQFNRHSAWRSLGRAWLATGDEKYAHKWVELLRSWLSANPPGTPWSWRTIEAGIRISVWLEVYFAFMDAEAFTPRDQVAMLNGIAEHAEYLMPEGRFSSGSNWGMIESQGLLKAGLFVPEFANAQAWEETAWERIRGEIDAQVYPDGAQVELTPSYHGGVASMFLDVAKTVRDAGFEVPAEYSERVEKMYEFLMYLAKPDGTEPMLGDAWPGSWAGALRTGQTNFGRQDMAWLLTNGAEGQPPADISHSFPHANYHVMRSAWLDPDARWLLFDTAPWGGGHQQPDNLHIIVYAYGTTLLPDSGSYLYYGDGRAWHARTSSHSTLTVDDTNQNKSPGHLEAWHSDDVIDYADGWHEGYEGITSRRRVLFARPDYWAVLDTVAATGEAGAGEHTVDQHFQCAPGDLTVEGDAATLVSEAGPGLSITPLRAEGVSAEKLDGWVSWVYTKREPRPVLRIRREGELPVSYLTLLMPFADQPAAISARELPLVEASPTSAAVEVRFADHTDYLFMADEVRQFRVEEIDLTGRCRAGLVRVDAAGVPIACSLVDGNEMTIAGQMARP